MFGSPYWNAEKKTRQKNWGGEAVLARKEQLSSKQLGALEGSPVSEKQLHYPTTTLSALSIEECLP